MKYAYTFIGICIFILLFKIPDTAGLYLTDGNNYILYAKLLQQGKVLYRDIYLDNFPLMIYISVLYRWLTFGSMQFFNLTTTLEKTGIAALLYFITVRTWKNHNTAFLAATTFLFSYTVMASSFQLGFFTSVLFILVSYFFTIEKKLWWAGLFAALAVLTKAYSVFLVLGLFLSVVLQYKRKSIQFVIAGMITGIIVMIPTILFAFPEFLEQTLHFGLVRAPSVDKTNLYYLFIVYDFLIFFLCIWNVTLWKKNLFLAAGTVLLFLFFLLYKDVYYAYFSYFPLLAALGTGYLLETKLPFLEVHFPKAMYVTILIFAALISFSTYLTTSRFVKKIPNEKKLIEAVEKEKPTALYGHSILVNGVSYYTDIPIYNNMYEITTAFFTNGKMNQEEITTELLKTKTLLLLYSYTQGKKVLYDPTVIDPTQFEKRNCKVKYTQFLEQVYEGVEKQISILRCY